MRPTLLSQTLAAAFRMGRYVHIEASPGVGKTHIVRDTAQSMGDDWGFIQKHVPTLQPEDLALPAKAAEHTDRMVFLVADWLPLVGDDSTPEFGVILLDELPQGDNAVQKTLANMIQEREVYGKRIKPGWTFVSTGNRQSDRAGANRILSHLRARATSIALEASLDDSCNWALDHAVPLEMIAFWRFRPGLLNDFNANLEINPNPRSWVEGVAAVLGKVPHDAELECFTGAVGEGPAAEFMSFLQIHRQLPNIDALIMDPDSYDVPEEPAIRFAVATGIAHRTTMDNFERIMRFANRLPIEFTVLVVRDAIKVCPRVVGTRAYIEFASTTGRDALR